MMKTIAALAATALLACGANAQQGPAAPAPKPTPTAKAANAPRSTQSIECSKEADAKGLHGKARKSFRSQCKSGSAKAK